MGFPHLTLAQVFAALSYFSDQQDEIMHYIEPNFIEPNFIPKELMHPLVRELG